MRDRNEAKRVLVYKWDRLSINQIETAVNVIFQDFERSLLKSSI